MKEALNLVLSTEHMSDIYSGIIFFNVAELHEKLKVDFSQILLISSDEGEGRNKLIWLKNEVREYTLMNVTFNELLEHSNNLMMVNKSEIISIEAVHSYRYDFITLKNFFPGWSSKQVVLSRNYRKDFYSRIGKQ